MLRAAIAAISLAAIAACTPPASETTAPDAPVAETPTVLTQQEATAQDVCGARQYAGMVGANIAAVQLPAGSNIRIIRPDSAVTEDFRPDRLNVLVDANGVITGFGCY